MVPTSALIFEILSILIAVGFPIALLFYFRRQGTVSWKAIGVGALVWFVFTQVLEKLLHLYVLQVNSTAVELMKQPWLYALYGGLAAGIFEEVGRYIAMRYWLKNNRDRIDGISYGIGHGGFEAVFLVLNIGVITILSIFLLNNGTFESTFSGKLPAESMEQIKSGLLNSSPWLLLLGGVERIFAVLVQIALSLVVLLGIRRSQISYLFYAILLHAGVDAMVAYLGALKVNILVIEGYLLVVAALCAWFIRKTRTLF